MKKGRLLAIICTAVLCLGTFVAATACTPTEQENPEKTKYAVTYLSGADDASGEAPAAEQYEEGASVTLKGANVFTREGYTFENWSFESKTYAAGAKFTMPAKDVAFTAVWKEKGEEPGPGPGPGPEPEVPELPEGTLTVESIRESTLRTENGDATANWFARYAEEGFVLTAEVADLSFYAEGSNVYSNDGIEFYLDSVKSAKEFTEKTLHIVADASGRSVAQYALGEENVTGVDVTANALTIDGKTVAGYRITVTVPYAATDVVRESKNAAIALAFYNAENAHTGKTASDRSYGVDYTRVNTYVAVTDDDTYAENPNIAEGFWGAPNGIYTSEIWDTSHEMEEDGYIEMTGNDFNDNYIYMLNSDQERMYAEVKLSVLEFMTDAGAAYDAYPKFGVQIVSGSGSAGYMFYVDAAANEESGKINAGSRDVGYVTRAASGSGKWAGNWTTVGNLGADVSSADYQNENYIPLGIYRQGDIVVFYANGKAIIRLTLPELTEEGGYVGIVSFNLRLKAKEYKIVTGEEQLRDYYIDLDAESMAPIKNIDASLDDWTDEDKANPYIIPGADGQLITIYATKDAHGVNLFYDALHKEHKTEEGQWFMNTNAEFYLGSASTQYYVSADGQKSLGDGVARIATENEDGMYHTRFEIFVPYASIPGYNADSPTIPARFCWKVGGALGNLWETGDWWRTDGNNETDRGSLITDHGFLGATKRTIDGDESDWTDAVWTDSGRSRWAATLESDGLYAIIKLTQNKISNNRAFFSGADAEGNPNRLWWLNQNIEIQGSENMRAARIVYLNGQTYHTTFVNEAKAKYTAGTEGGDDVLVFEFFVARENLIGVSEDSETIKANIGGQLFADDTSRDNTWQMYLTNGEIYAAWSGRFSVTFELGYDGAAPDPIYVRKNGKPASIPTVGRGGYKFVGWFVVNPDDNEMSDREFTTDFTVSEDIIVRAKWENAIDGSLANWTQKQQENFWEVTGNNGKYVRIYAMMDDYGINVYYDVKHEKHFTTFQDEWWKNSNVEFFLGDKGGDAQQYFVSAAGHKSDNIDLAYFHTDTPEEGQSLYHTVAEVFVSYEHIDEFDKNSRYVNGFFAWKVDNGDGDFEGGYNFGFNTDGGYIHDSASDPSRGGECRRSTVFTRDGMLPAAKAADKTIDGDLSDWEETEFKAADAGNRAANVTAKWAAKRGSDGLYIAVKVEAPGIETHNFGGDNWWQNTNFELFGGLEAAHYSGKIMLLENGETVFTKSTIDEAKIVLTKGSDGANDTLTVEIFISELRSRPNGTRVDIGGQLWGAGRDPSFQDYARYIVF